MNTNLPTTATTAATTAATRPLVLVPACTRQIGEHPFQVVGRKYLDAVRLAGCTPLIVPAAPADELAPLLGLADGLLLTGSRSNVHPSHFGETPHDPDLPLDPARDALTLPVIRRALQHGLPLLGICRGAQEANVALGGSLHQSVHTATGANGPYADHRADEAQAAATQYGPAHRVDVCAGGLLDRLVGAPSFMVNSVHGQGVRALAPGLRAEALAPDGLVEAFSWPDGPGFNLFVQWHPEWQAASNPVSMRLLDAFGAACRHHQLQRPGRGGACA